MVSSLCADVCCSCRLCSSASALDDSGAKRTMWEVA